MATERSWKAMWDRYARRLEEQTGDDLETWKERVFGEAPDDEAGVRTWLEERDITGYPQSLLVMERFGYPDFLEMSDAELIDGQYEDREHLRPILDRILTIVMERHPEVEVAGRKGYVPLHTRRRQFAVVKATTKSRVDLGLRLDGEEPRGRLVPARSLANETINLRIPLGAVEDVDDEVVSWLDVAWERNL
jgi:hypothetical protein